MKVQTSEGFELIDEGHEYIEIVLEHIGPAFIGVGGIGLGIGILVMFCGITGIGLIPASLLFGGIGLYLKNRLM
ncbi:hypothetical protein ABMA67_00585 [Halobacteriovorax sp. RZ-3]|uniref:hypothetical protein n=1 Tax=Halobacteriovorax sp. RZ-3 TaxID=3157720 RepID=UPI003720D4ED